MPRFERRIRTHPLALARLNHQDTKTKLNRKDAEDAKSFFVPP